MQNKSKITFNRIISLSIISSLLILLFLLSSQNGDTSNNLTIKIAGFAKKVMNNKSIGDYLRLERKGNEFTQYYSNDGENWDVIDKKFNINMNKYIYIGFVVSSHSDDSTCTAVFKNISVTSSNNENNSKWDNIDIGDLRFNGSSKLKNNILTVCSGGWSSWDKVKEYHFVYKKIVGDFTINARLYSIENTDYWSLAGLLARDTLDFDSNFSGAVITPRGALSPFVSNGGQLYMKWSHTQLYDYNFITRKALHFLGYLVLALTIYLTLSLFVKKRKRNFFIVIFICFAIAAFDEFHQSFVAQRNPTFTDVIIDTFGSFIGLSIMLLVLRLRRVFRISEKVR